MNQNTTSQPPIQDQPIEDNQQPPPPTVPKSRLPKLTFIFIILILFIAGYFVLSARNQPQPEPVSTSQTPTVIPTVDPTSDWQTYTNEDLGFSILYPENYLYKGVEAGVTHSPYESYSLIELKSNENQIDIAVANNTLGYKLNELIGNGPFLSYTEDIINRGNLSNIKIDGVDAIRVDNIPAGQAGVTSDILFIKRNKIYQIVLSPSDVDVNLFNQILSTIKFTE